MKIFLSWSGPLSHAIAEHLSTWIKCVLQASQPWISSRDIDRGAIWYTAITEQLSNTSAGIVCLTQENKHKPWILFETGALAKGLTSNRVCTFLIDLQPSDLDDPLAQFNHTLPESKSMWGLVRTLNGLIGEQKLDERILKTVFDTYWDQFEEGMKLAIERFPPGEKAAPRSDSEILIEILNSTRSLTSRVRDLEKFSGSPDNRSRAPTVREALARKEAVAELIDAMLNKGDDPDSIIKMAVALHQVPAKHVHDMLLERLLGSDPGLTE